MRTYIIVLAALLLCSNQAMSLSGNGNETKEEVKKRVINKLYSSDQNEQGVVNAKFQVNEEGMVKVESIESENQNLKEFVTEKLDGMVLKLSDKIKEGDRSYNLNILFKREH